LASSTGAVAVFGEAQLRVHRANRRGRDGFYPRARHDGRGKPRPYRVPGRWALSVGAGLARPGPTGEASLAPTISGTTGEARLPLTGSRGYGQGPPRPYRVPARWFLSAGAGRSSLQPGAGLGQL